MAEETAAAPAKKKPKELDGVKVTAVQPLQVKDPQFGPVLRAEGETFLYYGPELSEDYYVIADPSTPIGPAPQLTDEELAEMNRNPPPWSSAGYNKAHARQRGED